MNDHLLCYGVPGRKRCNACARNITGKISLPDLGVFCMVRTGKGKCKYFTKKLFK